MKNFRKPYLSMVIATVFLFVSCEQYDIIERVQINNFDYSFFKNNKDNPVFEEIFKELSLNLEKCNKSKSQIEKNRKILETINSKLDSKLNLPNSFLELTELKPEEIFDKSLKNNWMTIKDVDLTKSFLIDFKSKGIDLAISNYERKVLKMNLNEVEFNKKNAFINTIMFMKYMQPQTFYKGFSINKELLTKTTVDEEGLLACILASIVLVASVIGLAGCATVIACGLSLFAFGYSFNNWMNKCVGQHSVM